MGFFPGKDATRSFLTGDFKNDLTDNLDGIADSMYGEIENWENTYAKSADYKQVGVLCGNFYQCVGDKEPGKPTEKLLHAREMEKKAKETAAKDNEIFQEFPQCNSEWSQEKGGRVWCSEKRFVDLEVLFSGAFFWLQYVSLWEKSMCCSRNLFLIPLIDRLLDWLIDWINIFHHRLFQWRNWPQLGRISASFPESKGGEKVHALCLCPSRKAERSPSRVVSFLPSRRRKLQTAAAVGKIHRAMLLLPCLDRFYSCFLTLSYFQIPPHCDNEKSFMCHF